MRGVFEFAIGAACVFRALSSRFYQLVDPLIIRFNGKEIPEESLKYQGGNLPYCAIDTLELLLIGYVFATTKHKLSKLLFGTCIPLIMWDLIRQYTEDPYTVSKVDDWGSVITLSILFIQAIYLYKNTLFKYAK